MRPTGPLHLGNLHGALANWVNMQKQYDCFFFIADWHALTSDYEDTANISKYVRNMLIDWLSAGLLPDKSTLFIQSRIKEHAELFLILSMITPVPWLERNPTYKDQIVQLSNKDLSTFGFLGYPVLQAADIIMYKAYGVPVYQLLGGKYRDRVRLYCDTTTSRDPQEYANRMQERIDQGYTALKMDIGIPLLRDTPGTIINDPRGDLKPWQYEYRDYRLTKHPFTAVQVTDKGVDRLMEFLDVMRSQIGYEIPMGTDHWGHFGVNEAIKIARAAEPYNLAYIEDIIPWQYTEQWKEITQSTTTPTQTGEDIYKLYGGFHDLIEQHAVDIVHPDPNTAGGILETKKIGDFASMHGIGFMQHHAAGPVSFLGAVHAAAATENFLWLEHHAVDSPKFEDLVTGIDKPFVQNGYVKVPENPGIGVELDEEVVREFLVEGEELFAPTPEWDEMRAWDRLWS